jgi:amidase
MNRRVLVKRGEGTVAPAKRRIRSIGLAASGLALACLASYAAAQSPSYDEAADLALLAQNPNARMHYRRLSSPLRSKAALWEGMQAQFQALGESPAEYARLEDLVREKSAAQLQASVAEGALSYEEITRYFLIRIYAIESDDARYLNALIALNPQALEAARKADAERVTRIAAGGEINPNSFFGLPVLLKDNVGTAGMPTTAGAAALAENTTQDAFVTARLKANGAVILGKANLSEWAYFFCRGCPSGYSALGGQTLNPYGRLEFNTGGSSAGSGAAIAGGFAVAAVGSETAGSILSPASANSLVGLKPTTGSLSRSGVIPISSTLDTLGPMGRSVADVVALFNAMAGYDRSDKAMPLLSADMQLVVRDASIVGLRLGLPTALGNEPLIRAAVAKLANAGAVIVPVDFAPPDLAEEGQFMGAEMVVDLADYLQKWANPRVEIAGITDLQAFNTLRPQERMPYGQQLVDDMVDFMAAFGDDTQGREAEKQRLRSLVQEQTGGYLEGLFEQHNLDALVRINNSGASAGAFANYPALTVPAGYRDSGQPVGVTLYAPSFQEQRLIDLGAVLERAGLLRQAPEGY